jgi:hypothetical protein
MVKFTLDLSDADAFVPVMKEKGVSSKFSVCMTVFVAPVLTLFAVVYQTVDLVNTPPIVATSVEPAFPIPKTMPIFIESDKNMAVVAVASDESLSWSKVSAGSNVFDVKNMDSSTTLLLFVDECSPPPYPPINFKMGGFTLQMGGGGGGSQATFQREMTILNGVQTSDKVTAMEPTSYVAINLKNGGKLIYSDYEEFQQKAGTFPDDMFPYATSNCPSVKKGTLLAGIANVNKLQVVTTVSANTTIKIVLAVVTYLGSAHGLVMSLCGVLVSTWRAFKQKRHVSLANMTNKLESLAPAIEAV